MAKIPALTPQQARKLAVSIRQKTDPNSSEERYAHKRAAAKALEEYAEEKETLNGEMK